MSSQKLVSVLDHWIIVDIINKLISDSIAPIIDIKTELIPNYVTGPIVRKYTNIENFSPRECYFLTVPQVEELFAISTNRINVQRMYEILKLEVLPLFNKHDDLKENTMSSLPDNQPQKFHNDLFGDLTTLTHEDGSIWFIAKEVAGKLGYARPSDAIKQHCKGTVKHRMPSGTGFVDYNIISESDLYRLVIRSKLPEAEKFEEWVTTKVLPSIRKTGNYGQPALPDFNNPAIAARAWADKVEQTEALRLELKEKAPLIGFAETVAKSDNGILVRDLAYLAQNEHYIKIGEKRLWDWMRIMGFIHKQSTKPIQEWIAKGYFVMQPRMVAHHSGMQEHMTTKITGKGQIYFINKLKEYFSRSNNARA